MPVVDLARIYALSNRIEETNTLGRLKQLHLNRVFTRPEYNELEQSYAFMLHLRFVRQVSAILDENRRADNNINPKKLSPIEQTMLKEIFRRIEKFQSKLEFDFIGLL
jgi:CBS domain-containing protein